MLADDSNDSGGLLFRHQLVAEGEGIELIGADRCIAAAWSIDHIVEISPLLIPEFFAKGPDSPHPLITAARGICHVTESRGEICPDL
jgi:hypothetical protein